MEAWVFGMRKSDESGSSWERTVHYRLTRQAHLCLTTAGTKTSEQRLGLTRSIYLFLGRCDPAFGDTGIACRRPGGDVLVAPFDTGGMLQGHIKLNTDLADHELAALVRQHWMTGQTFPALWMQWGLTAYSSSSEYTLGHRPSRHRCTDVDLTPNANAARAWTWEGTVTADAAACRGIVPEVVVLSDQQLDRYRTWLRDSDILTGDAYRRHVEWLSEVRLDPEGGAPANVLNEHLSKESQW